MAIQEMAWVIDNSKAEGSDYVVLLMLANHYNRETGQCNPGYRRIAHEARIGRSTVGDAVARLVALGELAVDEIGGGRRTSHYHFPWLDPDPAEWRSSVREPDASESVASGKTRLASGGPPISVRPGPDRSLKQNHEPRRAASSGGSGGSETRTEKPASPYDSLPSAREIERRQNLGERANPDQQSAGLAAARNALAVARAKTRPAAKAADPELELDAPESGP